MSNVDIFAICQELNELLENARVDKAYQPTKDTVVIRFHKGGIGRIDIVFQAGVRMHSSQYPLQNPKIPPNFPMLLRKYIKGATVRSVKQYNFDRIVEIKVSKEEDYTLVVELFSKGNIILLNNENKIILPLKHKMWSDRKITSKEEYKYPPSHGINPINFDKEELEKIFEESDKDLIRTLALSGLGGNYAEEVLLRCDIDKKVPANQLTEIDIDLIYNIIKELFKPLIENKLTPMIIKGNKEDVLPLDLEIYKENEHETYDTYNEAADEFYSSRVKSDIEEMQNAIWSKKVNKYAKRLKIQEETLEKFKKTIIDSTRKGDLIYTYYSQINEIQNIIQTARQNHSWQEISKIVKKGKKDKVPGLELIESIDKLGNITLKLEDDIIVIDSNIPIPENAEVYYEKGKKAKRKINGTLIAIENTKKQLEKEEKKKEIAMEQIMVPQKRIKKELKWFEKLRWFISSDGLLVIGGRDANSNEIVVKKHMNNNDVYLHSDIHGASSVVIKNEKNFENIDNELPVPINTLREAAIFAASFSSAWQKGFSSLDVYWVYPDQVTKTPQSGEFIKKGSFIVRGSRNYLRKTELMIAVGIVDYQGLRVMAGPVESVKKLTDNYVTIKPGYTKKEETARRILHKIDTDKILSMDDLIRVLPSGKCDFIK